MLWPVFEAKGYAKHIAQASGQSLDKLDKLTFPLPLLADKLATLRGDLHHGLGISVLRGVDVSCLSMSEAFVTFAGLASHVSQQRGRQSGGKAIGRLHGFLYPFQSSDHSMLDTACSYTSGRSAHY